MAGLFFLRRYLVFGLCLGSLSAYSSDWPPDDTSHPDYHSSDIYYRHGTASSGVFVRTCSQAQSQLTAMGYPYSMSSCGGSFVRGYNQPGHFSGSWIQFSRINCSSTFNSTFCGTDYMFPDPPEPDWSDFDDYCQSIRPLKVTLSTDVGHGWQWDHGGCRFQTSDVVPCLETPYDQYSCLVQYAWATMPYPWDYFDNDPETDGDYDNIGVDGGYDSSNEWYQTQDPAVECPYNNFSFGGSSYCYTGPGAAQGQEYPDGSERVNYWDGSYTINDGQGGSLHYNPDGTLKDPSTAPTGPGQGPGSTNTGCPPYAPPWYCTAYHSDSGSGSGSGSGGGGGGGDGTCEEEDCGLGEGAPDLPVEVIDFEMVEWSSGLASNAICPAPLQVVIPFANMTLEISYEPFCNLAAYLRPLLIAFAYLFSGYLVYRGLV